MGKNRQFWIFGVFSPVCFIHMKTLGWICLGLFFAVVWLVVSLWERSISQCSLWCSCIEFTESALSGHSLSAFIDRLGSILKPYWFCLVSGNDNCEPIVMFGRNRFCSTSKCTHTLNSVWNGFYLLCIFQFNNCHLSTSSRILRCEIYCNNGYSGVLFVVSFVCFLGQS